MAIGIEQKLSLQENMTKQNSRDFAGSLEKGNYKNEGPKRDTVKRMRIHIKKVLNINNFGCIAEDS